MWKGARDSTAIATMYRYSLPESTPGLVACWQSMTSTPSTGSSVVWPVNAAGVRPVPAVGLPLLTAKAPPLALPKDYAGFSYASLGYTNNVCIGKAGALGLTGSASWTVEAWVRLHEWGVHYNSNTVLGTTYACCWSCCLVCMQPNLTGCCCLLAVPTTAKTTSCCISRFATRSLTWCRHHTACLRTGHLLMCASLPSLPLLTQGFFNNDLASTVELKLHTWTHIAWRYTHERKEQAMFVNGMMVAQREQAEPLQCPDDDVYLSQAFADSTHAQPSFIEPCSSLSLTHTTAFTRDLPIAG